MYEDKIINEFSTLDFSINHTISTSWNMKNFHFHDLYEIYFSLSSGVNCFINDRIYTVEKGDIFLFSPSDFHKLVIQSNINYDRYFLLFSPEYIRPLCSDKTDLLKCFENRTSDFCPRLHLSEENCINFVNLLDKAHSYSNSVDYGSDVMKKLALTQILVFINSFYEKEDVKPLSKKEAMNTKIWPIIHYIDENLNENLTLDFLSSNFYISKYYMESLFKNTIGFSINEYIINKRILKSKELLKKNIPVSRVAEMVGFNSDSHFIRTFKKLIGISPKKYSKLIS